tara:strand:+ start:1990 stop:2829 length:840 start_codon:yes stop_codon:yes gene_type:complete
VAIKPVTNENALNKSEVNRAEQTSFRSEKGNARVVIRKSGGRGSGTNIKIGLKDIDVAIIGHMNNIMKPKVKESNEIIKVPVLYGNEERWKSVRGRGTLRDRNGSIILPVIVIKRTDLTFDENLPQSFKHDVKGEFVNVIKSSSGWSQNNRYSRFNVLTGKKPIQEFVKTGMPDFVNCTYTVVMMTSYMEQMNDLNSLMIEHLKTYWGDQTSYRFRTELEGGISNEEQMESQGERLIRNEFSMSVKGYIMSEFTENVFGKKSQAKRDYSKNVVFSEKIT